MNSELSNSQKRKIVSLAKQIALLMKTHSKNIAELTELQRLYINSNLWAKNLPLSANYMKTWAQGSKKINTLKNKLTQNTNETRSLLAQLKSLYPSANVRSLTTIINKLS